MLPIPLACHHIAPQVWSQLLDVLPSPHASSLQTVGGAALLQSSEQLGSRKQIGGGALSAGRINILRMLDANAVEPSNNAILGD